MRFALLAAFAAVFCAAGATPKASFDCTKAATPVEKLICSDDGLATLDVQMATVFTGLVAAHPESTPDIRASQRVWLLQRGQCTAGKRQADLSCLKDQYGRRMALLQGNDFLVCSKPKTAGKSFTVACSALNNPLRLSLVLSGSKSAEGNAELAKLSVTKSGGKPQDFKLDGQIFFAELDSALELIDINLDGFDDIKLATATSAGPNMSYEYWLYAPKADAFQASKLGEQLSGFDVMPDAKTKTIKVTGRSNCCSWNASTYGWNGEALRLRLSEDNGEFSPTDLPGLQPEQSLCGSETKHFNDAGLLTHIDLALGATDDYECAKETLAEQAKLLDAFKQAPKGYKVEAKDKNHFAIVFDKPVKPVN